MPSMVKRKADSVAGNFPVQGLAIRLVSKPEAILKLLTTAMNSTPLLAAMGTCDSSGKSRVRMVVIRKVDKAGPAVYACTDIQSKKIKDIQRLALGELCFWLSKYRVQIRLLVRWTVLNMSATEYGNKKNRHLLEELWAGLSAASRRLFDSGRPELIDQTQSGCKLELNASGTPPMKFAVLAGQILEIDALAIVEPEHIRFSHRKTGKNWKTARTPL